jgi:hypothetical protein
MNHRYTQNGMCKSNKRLYKIWWGMVNRCGGCGTGSHERYFDRGIYVCEEWKSLGNFVSWSMNNGYSDALSIDRIDNDKGYSPQNCRWVTAKKQARNRSDNVFYEYKGIKKTIPEWAEIYGFNVITLVSRIVRMGWSMERALTERPRTYLRTR